MMKRQLRRHEGAVVSGWPLWEWLTFVRSRVEPLACLRTVRTQNSVWLSKLIQHSTLDKC